MTDQTAAPPSIPTATAKPRRRWRWLTITLCIIFGAIFFLKILGSYSPIQLEVRRNYNDSIEVINVGDKPITITKVTFNDREDCTFHTNNAELKKYLEFKPATLKVGDKRSFGSAGCLIVRANIETDAGSVTYSFTGN